MVATKAERDRGWVEFICPDHGTLVITTAEATVTCKCRKRAYLALGGEPLGKVGFSRK